MKRRLTVPGKTSLIVNTTSGLTAVQRLSNGFSLIQMEPKSKSLELSPGTELSPEVNSRPKPLIRLKSPLLAYKTKSLDAKLEAVDRFSSDVANCTNSKV
jgi:hypothetical protein